MTLKRYITLLFGVILTLLFILVTWFSLLNGRAFVNSQINTQGNDTLYLVSESMKNALAMSEDEAVSRLNKLQQLTSLSLLSLQRQGASSSLYLYQNFQQNQRVPSWFVNLDLLSSPLQQRLIEINQQAYVVQLRVNLSGGYQHLFDAMVDTFYICAFLILLSWLFARMLAIKLIKPMFLLEKHTQEIADKNYSQLPEVNSVREMNSLIDSHNKMTQQVKSMMNELSERLEHTKRALYRDELTQLGNRRLFSAQFSQILADPEITSGALIITRLSEFEHIRSQEGFQVARSLVEDSIHILQMSTKQGANTRLYRLNEYEFGCVLLHVDKAEISQLLSVLSSEFNQLQNKYQRRKTILIGATLFNSKQAMSQILNQVDEALSRAVKELHCFHLYDSERPSNASLYQLRSKQDVMNVIRNAELHFQQQNILLTDENNVMFAELFTRCVLNGNSIAIPQIQTQAEKFNCSADLDKRIIEQLRVMYLQQKLTLPVSVNISPFSLLNDEFVSWLVKESHEYRDFFRSIIWELDELALSQITESTTLVNQMQALGSKVAIDHFGTGDYTLQSMRKWQVDIIKLDGCYIHDIGQDQSGEYFVENIIKLAHSLGIVVVCEQIETEQEKQMAKHFSTDGLQGYFMCQPRVVS